MMECRCCHHKGGELHTTPFHSCTEAGRQRYYAELGMQAPPRGDDACSGVTILCENCWLALRPEERLKYHLDLMMDWQFENDEDRIHIEAEIARRVLA